MPDATSSAPTAGPRKRRYWPRVLGWAFGLTILLLAALYFIVTSSEFLKKHVLPRISKSLNANVTASSVTLHPFSEVIFRDLKVQSTNIAPLLTAAEVRVKYSLLDILGGNIRIDEAVLTSPVFQLVQNSDGTSNLDPLTKAAKTNARRNTDGTAGLSKPIQVDIRKLILSDATIRRIQNHKVGTGDLVEFTNLEMTLVGVKNDGRGKIEFSCVMRDENNPPAPAMYGLLRAKLDGKFDFTLASNLQPASVLGDAHMKIAHAAGSFSDFANLDGTLHGDVSATEFKRVTLSFEKEGSTLGELHATGPYNATKGEGQLNVELLSVDKQVLNLFGARYGIDFGSTTISSSNTLQAANAGAVISAAGQLRAGKFQLGRTNESTPPIELRADYNLSVDKSAKTALLRNLDVVGSQNGRALLRGELTSPMTVSWGKKTNAVGDSSLNLAIIRLKVAEWKAFFGNLASAGTLDLNMKLLSQQGGTELMFDTTNRLENLTTQIDGQPINDATVLFNARGRATDLKQFDLRDYSVQLVQSNQTALLLSGSGIYDRTNSSADLQVTVEVSAPRLLQLLNRSGFTASSGTAELRGRITQSPRAQTVVGNLNLTRLTGEFGKNEFHNFGATMTLDVEKTPSEIAYHKVIGNLTGGRNSGGDFEFSGTNSLGNKPSQLNLTFSDFNQDGLRPFLEPLFADRRLTSISMNGSASARILPNGRAEMQADVAVSNLVVSDPVQQVHSAPLEARVIVDAAMARQIADLRKLEIALTPTERAKNELQLQGRIDFSRSNYVSGDLKLAADAVDLTSYYDLFNETNKAPLKSGGNNRKPPAAAPEPQKERSTNHLPFTNFTLTANVKDFYLREVTASNFHAAAKLDGSHVLLKPFQMTLSGSPVAATADVDMNVPGWRYALTVSATNIPYAPLWNSFNPQRKGEVGGTVTAYGNINGVGTTGEGLQKSLAGDLHIGTTNLNLNVVNIRSPMLRDVVEIVAHVRELIENPPSALSRAADVDAGRLSGDFAEDLNKSPIDVIAVEATADTGRVNLHKVVVRNEVFEASVTNGEITLAPILTNSAINLPIHLAVNTAIAQRNSFFHLTRVQTNGDYVSLPDFFSEAGTIGSPKKNINEVTLVKSTIQEVTNAVGSGASNLLVQPLQGLENLLKGSTNTNPSTNQPATNQVTNTLLNRTFRPMAK
jgi:hypothetical protein